MFCMEEGSSKGTISGGNASGTAVNTYGDNYNPVPPPQAQNEGNPNKGMGRGMIIIGIIVLLAIVASAIYLVASRSSSAGSSQASAVAYSDLKAGNYSGALVSMSKSVLAQPKLNVTYKGFTSLSASMFGVAISTNKSFTVNYIKNGSDSSLVLRSSSPSAGASSLTDSLSGIFSEMYITLNNNSYVCSNSGYNCTYGNFSASGIIKGLASNKTLNITDSKVSSSSYDGQGCMLASGNYSLEVENVSALVPSGGYVKLKGSYNTCISKQYDIPLSVKFTVDNMSESTDGTVASIAINAMVELNETSFSTNTDNNEITSMVKASDSCAMPSDSFIFPPYNCTDIEVGSNGIASLSLVSDINPGSYAPSMACITYALNSSTLSPPMSEFVQPEPFQALSNGSSITNVTMPCYNSKGQVVKPVPGSFFVGILYYNSSTPAEKGFGISALELGSIQTDALSKPITLFPNYTYNSSSLQSITTTVSPNYPITTTVPPSQQMSSANYTSCSNFTVALNVSGHISRICTWGGGSLELYTAGGDPGFVGAKVLGSGNQTYIANSTDGRCLAYAGTFYAPAGNYTVHIGAGAGGGFCGPAEAVLESS